MKVERHYVVRSWGLSRGCQNRHEPARVVNVTLEPDGWNGQVFTLIGSEQELGGLDVDDKLLLIVTDSGDFRTATS